MNKEIKEIVNYIIDTALDSIECCICFSSNTSANIINLEYDTVIKQDDLIKCPCNDHYVCVKCLQILVTDYENHPINENNSHVYCMYPFKDCLTIAGTKNTFSHNSILKILNEKEREEYTNYSERFILPGFLIIKCPCKIRSYLDPNEKECTFPVIIEIELIKTKFVGDLVVECHQNEKCCQVFCYHCRQTLSKYALECYSCKIQNEYENPNRLNYFFNKNKELEKNVSESNYLYYNKDITVDIAFNDISELILDINKYMICPICKATMIKTEKCNSMEHHQLERCYVCGRIAKQGKSLSSDHWSSDGINGCYRFGHDIFLKKYIENYNCNEDCTNHENGGICNNSEHLNGFNEMEKIRHKTCIYHNIKSLLPNIRYKVLDLLYDTFQFKSEIELLPYKQTFIFLEKYKDRLNDYSEEVLYDVLNIKTPQELNFNKKFFIETEIYLKEHFKPLLQNTYQISLPPPPPLPQIRLPPPPPPPLAQIRLPPPTTLSQLLPQEQYQLPQIHIIPYTENQNINLDNYIPLLSHDDEIVYTFRASLVSYLRTRRQYISGQNENENESESENESEH
jgi:hypothetical protein